ncbi:MAG: hypothetical protein K8H86_09910 [Ignavibacteriaceae bacterium]|nr:hypothetical protein [Ignavibacteriaceae bacterium]
MIKKIFLILFILTTGSNFYAQTNPSSFFLPEDGKLYKANAANPASNSISDILTIGDTIWLGSSRGVSVSFDKGENWTNFSGTDAFGSESISAIGAYKGIFWAATAHSVERSGSTLPEGSGLRYTTDKGVTWQKIPQPLDNNSDTVIVYGINKIRALPVTVSIQNLIYDIAFTPPYTIWISTFAGGLRKSSDMGLSWQRVILPPDRLNSISPTDTLEFCLQPVAGKFCSDNNLNHRVFSVIATNDSTLYVGTANGINKSTDYGISWRKFNNQNQNNPISGNFVVALGFNKTNNSIWGATWRAEGQTEFYGVSYTTDGGENWGTSLEGEKVHNFGFKSFDVIAPSDNGSFRSSNLGASWILPTSIKDKQTNIPINTNTYYAAGSQKDYVWLGSTDGLARLTETGGVWKGDWKVYFASRSLSSKTESYAFPNPFSPRQEICKIKYSTGGASASVTIRIFDFGMNYVRTVIQNATRGNPSNVVDDLGGVNNGVIDFWDGKNDNGSIVPNGVYFYRVEVDSQEPVFGKILVLQ